MVINGVPGGPPWPEFGMYVTTILSNVFLNPKDPNLNQIKQFSMFFGGQKVEKKQCRKRGFIYAYIFSYTSIYLHIPSYTSK